MNPCNPLRGGSKHQVVTTEPSAPMEWVRICSLLLHLGMEDMMDGMEMNMKLRSSRESKCSPQFSMNNNRVEFDCYNQLIGSSIFIRSTNEAFINTLTHDLTDVAIVGYLQPGKNDYSIQSYMTKI